MIDFVTDRHSKCDNTQPRCKPCARAGDECVRVSTRTKFKTGSSGRYDSKFGKEQPWLKQSKHARIQFVDQTPELENYYATELEASDHDPAREVTNTDQPVDHAATTAEDYKVAQSTSSLDSQFIDEKPKDERGSPRESPSLRKRQRTSDYEDVHVYYRLPSLPLTPVLLEECAPPAPSAQHAMKVGTDLPDVSGHYATTQVEAEYRRLADTAAAAVPSVASGLLSPEIWKSSFVWPNRFTTTQCACLMRYFVDELAPGLDVFDPIRHCTTFVPQRARRCPPLLNAIFTLAAHQLFSIPKYKTTDGVVRYQGISLHALKASTAINYHNASLAYLIPLSADTSHVTDENLLMAAVVLRFHEELDASVTGTDPEMFLHTLQIFTNAQFSADSTSPPLSAQASYSNDVSISTPQSNVLFSVTDDEKSYRHAAFRIALRQDITAALSKQRPMQLPLHAWQSCYSMKDVEDAIWSDRLLAFCSQVVQFCFAVDDTSYTAAAGSYKAAEPGMPGPQTRNQTWRELKKFETFWDQYRPLSFGAIQYEEAHLDTSIQGRARQGFPQIWYVLPLHALGTQYFELARLLLRVYDPAIPRLGPPAILEKKRVAEEVRRTVSKICGISLSNGKAAHPAMVVASLAIRMFAEYIHDQGQRTAMIDLLRQLETDFGWPTKNIIKGVQEGWEQ